MNSIKKAKDQTITLEGLKIPVNEINKLSDLEQKSIFSAIPDLDKEVKKNPENMNNKIANIVGIDNLKEDIKSSNLGIKQDNNKEITLPTTKQTITKNKSGIRLGWCKEF